ncbi:hypothetical protein EXIGLDRAFT_165596 [Exidia glandulosa HHB12029]|uniref:Uncharacterized protein n=1 Tax=Exidia glandulosa HHB12029 TaxID=1314781 RepID=A0A165N4K6_EXIGL|nr:hypothetical protein EXIGLDRAFT_165596 [Exidia glandulosa HHB12029]
MLHGAAVMTHMRPPCISREFSASGVLQFLLSREYLRHSRLERASLSNARLFRKGTYNETAGEAGVDDEEEEEHATPKPDARGREAPKNVCYDGGRGDDQHKEAVANVDGAAGAAGVDGMDGADIAIDIGVTTDVEYSRMAPAAIARRVNAQQGLTYVKIESAKGGLLNLHFNGDGDDEGAKQVSFLDVELDVFDESGVRDVLGAAPTSALVDTLGPKHLAAIPGAMLLNAKEVQIIVSGAMNPALFRWSEAVFDLHNIELITIKAPDGHPRAVILWKAVLNLLKTVLRHQKRPIVMLDNVGIKGWDKHQGKLKRYGQFPQDPKDVRV